MENKNKFFPIAANTAKKIYTFLNTAALPFCCWEAVQGAARVGICLPDRSSSNYIAYGKSRSKVEQIMENRGFTLLPTEL